jgi:bifunctional UDP-N-acetylglucosamine pyrophosphorylase / glucosamine-1-phosphate N-acetyltransferase
MTAVRYVAVLAAGEGKRLGAGRPKVLTPLWGRPAVRYPVEAARALQPERIVVVGGAHLPAIQAALGTGSGADVFFARQASPQGTGDALLSAREALPGAAGSLLVLYGDCPLITPGLLQRLVDTHAAERAALTVLTMELERPAGYGRIVRDGRGELQRIVEEGDADAQTRLLREVNTGVYVVEVPAAFEDLARAGRDNAQGEIYLTELVALTRQRGQRVATLRCDDPGEVIGFNDQRELTEVRAALRRRIVEGHLAAGVEIMDPASTYIDADVRIEAGARILPCTVIEGECRIATGCEVGPFAHLRHGTVLHAGAEVGNFTETKNASLGPGTKAKHLSYLGDATIGANANIGAGTITANYDGKAKHQSRIGDRAFIGSGTVLVAPVTVEDEAVTGAGAVVTRRSVVPPRETWVGVPARPLRPRKDP